LKVCYQDGSAVLKGEAELLFVELEGDIRDEDRV